MELLVFKKNTNVAEAIPIFPAYLSRIERDKCVGNKYSKVKDKKECIAITGMKYKDNYGPRDKKNHKRVRYLPFHKDKATYMFPEPEYDRDTVFVTSLLSGCDVWVGWCNKQVFVIHVSSSKKDAVQNLLYKETLALATIGKIRSEKSKACVAHHRFSFDYTSDTKEKQVIKGVTQYWKKFRGNHELIANHFYGEPEIYSLFYMVNRYQDQRKQWRLKMRYINKKKFIFNQ